MKPTTSADNSDFNKISELDKSDLTPEQIKRGIENGYYLINNIKDYGALGDGVSDDTQAFILAQANGGNVFIPDGIYKTNILITSDTNFIGESLRHTIIEPFDINKPAISIDRTDANALIYGFGLIDNLTIRGILGTGVGLSLKATAPATINDLKLGRLVFKLLDTGIYVNSTTAAGEVYQLIADVLFFEKCTTYSINAINLNQSTFNVINIDDVSTAFNRFKLSGNNNKINHLYTSGGIELQTGTGLVIDLLRFETVKLAKLVNNSNALIKYNMISATINRIMVQVVGESNAKIDSLFFLSNLGLHVGKIQVFGTSYFTYLIQNLNYAAGTSLNIDSSDLPTQFSLSSTYPTINTLVSTKKLNLKNILNPDGTYSEFSKDSQLVVVGLNEVDDMTSIIQSYIDKANASYIASTTTRFFTHLPKLIIPAGRYKVSGLYLKSGITIEMIGNLIPLTSTSNVIYIAGSYINIEGTLNIDCVDQTNYNGIPISIDTADATTVTLLATAPFNRINYVTIENLNIKGNTTGTTSTGININSNGSTKGIAWIKINSGTIRDFINDIVVTTSNGGYFNSNIINISSNQCINGLKLNAVTGSEISSNEFNYTIQPRDVVNATGITLLKASNNIFNGTIWDWKETYGLVVSDTGNNNTYGRGFIPTTFLHKTRILGQSSTVGDSFGGIDNFNIIYDHNETSHNALGWQDNLLMYADKLFTTTVTPAKSSTFAKAFTPATAINHAWNTTWGTAGGIGEIQLTITDIPKFRFYAISLGFQTKARIARAIKMEYQLDNAGWVTVYDVTDNLSTNVMYRTLGGSGYDANKLRFTFNTGVDATDPANPVAPSSNILAIQSIAVFGAGMRNFTVPTNLSNSITPEMFGAKGDGTTDDTVAINLALARTTQMVKLTGVGKYACNNIILNNFANIDLQLTNYNDTDPILCINGADINLNKTIIDLRTGTYAGNCIELDTTKPWFNTSSVARLKADDVQVYNWYGVGTGMGLSTAFKINIDRQIFSSFWDITRFRSMTCKNGVVVTTSGTGYFTSNKFRHLQTYKFIDKPLYLESSPGAEISANYFYMELQPSTGTIDGIKILGGRHTKRNIIDGELWDWSSYVVNDSKVLEDKGWFTQLRHIDSNEINANLTTINDGGNGFSLTPTKSLNIPTNAQGKSMSGHADNYLAYANLRTGFTIVKSHTWNSGSDTLLFSLDTYLGSRWTGLTPTDIRTIEITLHTAITADAVLIAFQLNGIPKNVKIEYYGGATQAWVTQVDKVNNTDTLVGKRGSTSSFSTGLINTTKIRITMSDPYTYTDSSSALGWVSTDTISVSNIYLLSNQHKTIGPYVDASVPILLGDLRSSKTVVQSISGLTQTKCLKVMDESGTFIGYMPLYS